MQTFLPYESIEDSVECLDSKRLFNQRNETMIILDAASGKIKSWQNHPAVNMWRNHLLGLKYYLQCCNEECKKRGMGTVETYFKVCELTGSINPNSVDLPSWFGSHIHATHRQKLLSKDLDWYSRFNWGLRPDPRSWYPVPWGKKKEIGYAA